jgi:phosphohistidine phosphatase
MHELFVLRHAKSSWDDPRLDDHDRPLAARGRRAAALIKDHLSEQGIHPSLVLCSTARRARETLERVDPDGERVIESELYGAGAGDLLERLRRVPEELCAVMVIGHNPAIQQLVLALTGGERQVAERFPTGALATLRLRSSWSELAPGQAELAALVRPKDLEHE